MAEAALFGLASKLLGEIASPAFKEAYERVQSIRHAKKDLEKLQLTIETIQAVLLDAEKKQYHSVAVKNWMERVRDVLYEADDLFDDVSTDYLLKQQQQKKESRLSKKVRPFLSKLSISKIASNDDIAKRVKAIRKRLDEIAKDMAQFSFIQSSLCENQMSGLRERPETKPFVDEKVVIGRDDDKHAILEFLFDESDVEQSVSVIAIVGIGGMGKTTLAQLVYNDSKVQMKFQKKWWVCISNIGGETNVLERIARSMDENFRCGRGDPKEQISKSIGSGGNYLLVLDDVWDNDLPIWFDIMSLLSSGTKGSKIIVTTRCLQVPRAMQMDKCRFFYLKGLSEDNSWKLFTRICFAKEQENDPKWVSLGREIVKKCANVPLAIKCIAGLLRTKVTISEWESIKDEKLLSDGNSIKSVLKLSYDDLPSNLKNCFAYCSLFPEDSILFKWKLIYMWIAQGYVKPKENDTLESAGHAVFMALFRRSCFQEVEEDKCGEIVSCKMHDLVHELALDVAGKESLTLTTGFVTCHKNTRHVYFCREKDISGNIPQSLPKANQLRSFVSKGRFLAPSLVIDLDPLLKKFKLLRMLDLGSRGIVNVPSCIGDLKHLRYLDLSWNKFTSLPDSLTKLVNLLTLNICHCTEIGALPNDFRKLTNLRHFDIFGCYKLWYMPPSFGELTCLQHLSHFKVGRSGGCGSSSSTSSRLDVLAGMNLKGELTIEFPYLVDDWDEDECWKLPMNLQVLTIMFYPGMRMPEWGGLRMGEDIPSLLPNLVKLSIHSSRKIKHLPPFRCLPYLKSLSLSHLNVLEYVEDENEGLQSATSSPFFPCLEVLQLEALQRLKGWSPTTSEGTISFSSFPLLSSLIIWDCLLLKSLPFCPNLQTLEADKASWELIQQLTSTSHYCYYYYSSPDSTTPPSSLQTIAIERCDLLSFSGQTLTSLRSLYIGECTHLKNVYLGPRNLNVLEELTIRDCPGLELWEEKKRGIDWDSLPNLSILYLDINDGDVDHGAGEVYDGTREDDDCFSEILDDDCASKVDRVYVQLPDRLPDSLQKLQTEGKLQIKPSITMKYLRERR